ncbi:MAG TPA: hypothetical protein VL326_11395 [Kofleriaceae bacterium]|jgi:hypothetical protein|nr:hypothetical protein [Kofleriaceae bacterium]
MESIKTIETEQLVTATGGEASASTGCVETPAERAERLRSPFEKIGGTVGGDKWRPNGPTIFNPRPQDILGTRR